MPEESVRSFQEHLRLSLANIFDVVPVEEEWAAIRDEHGLYSPRLDVAVGPFATGDLNYGDEFDRLVEAHEAFFHRLYDCHIANIQEHSSDELFADFGRVASMNWNARCLLAIEIENKVSRKHLMGGAINAAALGRVGIAVGWTAEKVRALVRLRSYLLFLARVGKNTFNTANLLVVGKDQLRDVLDLFPMAGSDNQ
jgi:hypothetical protein